MASCRERDRLLVLCGLTTLFTPPRCYGHLSSPARRTPKRGRFKSGGEGSASAAPAHQSPMTPGPRHGRVHRSEFQHARAVCLLGWNDKTPARKRLHRRAALPGLCQEANRPVACGWPVAGNSTFGVAHGMGPGPRRSGRLVRGLGNASGAVRRKWRVRKRGGGRVSAPTLVPSCRHPRRGAEPGSGILPAWLHAKKRGRTVAPLSSPSVL